MKKRIITLLFFTIFSVLIFAKVEKSMDTKIANVIKVSNELNYTRGMKTPDLIYPGQELVYVVRNGDKKLQDFIFHKYIKGENQTIVVRKILQDIENDKISQNNLIIRQNLDVQSDKSQYYLPPSKGEAKNFEIYLRVMIFIFMIGAPFLLMFLLKKKKSDSVRESKYSDEVDYLT